MNSCFLAEKEVHRIRPLWEKVFAEDSPVFTEYYFANKAESNLTFTRMDGEQIVSMLHLAPYMTGRMEPVCYIVGVATEAKYRRQGLMADMMKEALQFMWEEKQPFTFLMPANPAYYTPFQFTYIYDKPAWKLNEAALPVRYLETAAKYEAEFHLVVKEKGSLQIKVAKEEDYARLAEFSNELLKKNTDCYMLRNAHYYKILKKELVAQNGNLFMVEQGGNLKGILAYVKEKDKPGLQEVILSGDLAEWQLIDVEEYKPAIMARILRVEEMLGSMRSTGPVDLLVEIKDPVLGQNSGIYHLHSLDNGKLICKKRRSSTEKISADGGLNGMPIGANGEEIRKSATVTLNRDNADCTITIDDLTAFCFGYQNAEECFTINNESAKEEILEGLEQIKVLKRVFINEII